MSATVMDGTLLAAQHREALAAKIKSGLSLGIILATNNSATKRYVALKQQLAESLGVSVTIENLGDDATEAEIIQVCMRLSQDNSITGYIVQLPLPEGVSRSKVFSAVDPLKDVDGLAPQRLGKLMLGMETIIPATPRGILSLLSRYQITIPGATATVIGKGLLTGLPCAVALNHLGATVTSCDKQTKDLAAATRQADIVISAAGAPGLVSGDMIKPGATVIDVGTTPQGDRLIGDIVYDEVKDVAAYVSPVPGGVGPMTVISLFENLHDLTH